MSLINHKDVPIYIAVNTEGVYILDCVENVMFFHTSIIVYRLSYYIINYFRVYCWV